MRPFIVRAGSQELAVEVLAWERGSGDRPGSLRVRLDGQELEAVYRLVRPGTVSVDRGLGAVLVRLAQDGEIGYASADGCHASFQRIERTQAATEDRPARGEVTSPIPAVVVKVLVEEGQQVERGQALLVVTAMKLETTLNAPRAGKVTALAKRPGDRVSPGEILLIIAESEGGRP
jgi:3-methylcrotonyl-CoA carboxylase alpha subunit